MAPAAGLSLASTTRPVTRKTGFCFAQAGTVTASARTMMRLNPRMEATPRSIHVGVGFAAHPCDHSAQNPNIHVRVDVAHGAVGEQIVAAARVEAVQPVVVGAVDAAGA